jgi:hypothetical protein
VATLSTFGNYTEDFLYQQSVLEYRKFDTPSRLRERKSGCGTILVGYLIDDLGIAIEFVFGSHHLPICLSVFAYFLAARQAIWAIPLLVNPLYSSTWHSSSSGLALAFSLLLLACLAGREKAGS